MAHAHFIAGRDAEALSWAEMALRERSNHHSALRILAASCAMTGRQEQAQGIHARLRDMTPVEDFQSQGHISDSQTGGFRQACRGPAQGGPAGMTANRRLAAIMVADVVGYSRLMEADEAGTLRAGRVLN